MKHEDFIGVWKLIEYGEGKIITSQTHLVVQKDILWEVHPNTVYYENQQGPEVGYTFEGGNPAKLSLANGFKFLVKKQGDMLIRKLGPVYGSFPTSFRDNGNVGKYVLEEPNLAAKLNQLPPKVTVLEQKIRGFGTLKYDSNLHWWSCHTKFNGQKIILHISAYENNKFEPLSLMKNKLKALEKLALHQAAAKGLLSLFNESWNDEDEAISEEMFIERITLSSITLELDGMSMVWFKDGDLFAGHSIYVNLDANNNIKDVGIMG